MEKIISITGAGSMREGLSSKLTEFPEVNKFLEEGWRIKSIHPVQENYQGCWAVLIVLENPTYTF